MIGTAAEGLREFRRILSTAVIRRWPLYLRNVKQIIRQTDSSFDERAYGFGNLTDLLRAAHREGIVRVDRDRQGVIRVFQGGAAPAPSRAAQPTRDVYDVENDPNLAEDIARAYGRADAVGAVSSEAPVGDAAPVGGVDPATAADEGASEGDTGQAKRKKAPRQRRRSPASGGAGGRTGRARK